MELCLIYANFGKWTEAVGHCPITPHIVPYREAANPRVGVTRQLDRPLLGYHAGTCHPVTKNRSLPQSSAPF
jgi:hypothetical protein